MADRDATDVFSEWALRDRDLGMDSGHASSVEEMLSMALSRIDGPFSAADLGCGNGWVCRALEERVDCLSAMRPARHWGNQGDGCKRPVQGAMPS